MEEVVVVTVVAVVAVADAVVERTKRRSGELGLIKTYKRASERASHYMDCLPGYRNVGRASYVLSSSFNRWTDGLADGESGPVQSVESQAMYRESSNKRKTATLKSAPIKPLARS